MWPISAGSIVGQIMRFWAVQPEADLECKREENQNDKQKVMEMTGWRGQSEQLSLSGKHWKERKYREWARCQNLLKKKKRKHKAWHATFICHWRDATANPLNRAGSEGKRNTAPDSQETQDRHWSVLHRQLLDNKHRLWKGWWVIQSLP